VAADFSRLGKVIKDRYQANDPAEAAHAQDQTDADAGVREAFERLLAAGRDFGERIADVVAAEEVRTQAKQTGQQFNEAVTATADLLGEQLRGVFKSVSRHSDPVVIADEDAPVDSTEVHSAGQSPRSGAAEAADDDPGIPM
jgi:hypothetical protein